MFAEKLQSKTLFEGAFIHVVGRLVQDPETFSGHEKNLPNETRFLVNDEVMALQRRILKVTYELLGVHAPTNSLSSGRVADILYKVMLGNITRESGSATAANHAKLFRKIHSHYFCLSELLLNDLGKKMSSEIQRNIDSLASTAESLASELTKDCTAFTVNEELDYLTCVEFSDDKFPWKKVNSITRRLVVP
ncbi:hypothetical protein K440DRAFT_639414 [Wilcoxina mikolae CBS 423.85]|nr:hypothetical protein K440DRAFT_639414 [Wilcoxina mikolae CBS 423.85]